MLREKTKNHSDQGTEKTYRQSQIHLRQDELSLTSCLTEICQNLSLKEKSKTTLLKPQQQLLPGAQLEAQTCCWSSASFSCSSCSRRSLSSSACLCCSSWVCLLSSSCFRSSSSRRAFSSAALLATSSSLILEFPRYRLLASYFFKSLHAQETE